LSPAIDCRADVLHPIPASVGRMFLGGMLPGIIIGLSLMATNYMLSYKYDFPRVERAPFSKIARSALDGVVALIAPIIIIGSILTGFE
jgi:C4-dicarboxylate transporter DctM subunit